LNATFLKPEQADGAIPLWLATEATLTEILSRLAPPQAAWVRNQGFLAEKGRVVAIPDAGGAVAAALAGVGPLADFSALSLWDAAPLPERLPTGRYRLATTLTAAAATQFALGWLLGSYRYSRFRSQPKPAPAASLHLPPLADGLYAEAAAVAMYAARDLINAPANELGPEQLAQAATDLAREFGGHSQVCMGDALLLHYPLVQAVGAGSARAPRLIDCRWPRAGAPRVTLVGKGVCFDTGGLDLKPSASMLLMKKDMGGAACALGLARLLLAMRAPVELRLLIPAVENSVSGNAFRPGDVLRSRKGLSVEIGNTDAEGRLVLADALTDADSERPDLLIDLATLTGAARTALGPDLPAIFSSDSALAEAARAAGEAQCDPLWPLPLWAGYDDELASRVADLNNVSASPFAGAIVAALFLKRFVTATPAWLHVDLYAWNPRERPGRPVGAEAQGIRALYALIRQKFG
jgi:leucyl aminopeptidase